MRARNGIAHVSFNDAWQPSDARSPAVGVSMTELTGWQNFYVIVGSSAGALIGLQFVVIALLAERIPVRAEAGQAFATPNVVHFASALLLSAVLCAPWRGIRGPAVVWGVLGAAGIIYCSMIARRLAVQTTYRPVFEDWLFHGVLPFAAYAIMAASAYLALAHTRQALFEIALSALILLFVGIHNAWDSAAYHVFRDKS